MLSFEKNPFWGDNKIQKRKRKNRKKMFKDRKV